MMSLIGTLRLRKLYVPPCQRLLRYSACQQRRCACGIQCPRARCPCMLSCRTCGILFYHPRARMTSRDLTVVVHCTCGAQGDGEWEFVLDMVSELFSATLEHTKAALQGCIEYQKGGEDMEWDSFLATANVRAMLFTCVNLCAARMQLTLYPPRRRCTMRHTPSRVRPGKYTASRLATRRRL